MRTRYLNDDGRPKYTNQLIHEQSPYLRQHAHNPVEWFPWGDAAFAKARAEDKPIFLSIGYSTCHWCHVMEDESFDDEEVAALLNEHFISIKLDREQRPDLDDIYMTGVQFISGQGGWPMSNFITHDGEPFYAGTYFPKDNFSKLIVQLSDVWQNRREEVVAQAKKITESIEAYTSARSEAKEMPDELCKLAAAELVPRLDEIHGGFGGAPKFPNESQLHALLASVRRYDDAAALDALTLSLNKMSEGGIYDQICGGFHRYTVDAEWLVPHFEKMLYNQAQLVSVYSLAYGRTKNPGYKRVVDETITYLQRDMSDEYGAFYSATDADSEGAEGEFFVWQLDELKSLLSAEDFLLITELYQVSEAGNFEGANILNLNDSLEYFSATHNLPIESLLEIRERVHGVLYQHREHREHPLRDEKLITAWNAMMISALVDASVALDNDRYGDMAASAFNRIWGRAFDEQNGLSRICLDDQISIKANLEDYAYLAEAALKLHRYSLEPSYLVFAKTLVKQMLDLFWDTKGGFYNSALETDGPMISRARSPMDGAMPSANSAAMSALILLFQATNDIEVASKIDASIASFAGLISKAPSAFSYMCTVLDQYQNGANQSVQLCADGQIQVRLVATENGTVVKIKMAEGWHINAATDAAEDEAISGFTLIATEVMSHGVARYPESELFATGFQADDLKVYSGEVEILLNDAIGSDTVVLKLQACSDQLCLSPDTLKLAF